MTGHYSTASVSQKPKHQPQLVMITAGLDPCLLEVAMIEGVMHDWSIAAATVSPEPWQQLQLVMLTTALDSCMLEGCYNHGDAT